jgi:hypothetical protein
MKVVVTGKRNTYKVWSGNLKTNDHLRGLNIVLCYIVLAWRMLVLDIDVNLNELGPRFE